MDGIREHLMYRNSPLNICLAKITPQEHYELIRILLESKSDNITLCTHEATNSYVNIILKKLNVKFKQCWLEEMKPLMFDRHTEQKTSHQ
jgi:hypothetical protein